MSYVLHDDPRAVPLGERVIICIVLHDIRTSSASNVSCVCIPFRHHQVPVHLFPDTDEFRVRFEPAVLVLPAHARQERRRRAVQDVSTQLSVKSNSVSCQRSDFYSAKLPAEPEVPSTNGRSYHDIGMFTHNKNI